MGVGVHDWQEEGDTKDSDEDEMGDEPVSFGWWSLVHNFDSEKVDVHDRCDGGGGEDEGDVGILWIFKFIVIVECIEISDGFSVETYADEVEDLDCEGEGEYKDSY